MNNCETGQLIAYLHQQFPATVGHLALKEKINDCITQLQRDNEALRKAIETHRGQKLDDRCWLDDQTLYGALNDGNLGDNSTPPKDKMLDNCRRYIERRCNAGSWKSYQDLELELAAAEAKCERLKKCLVNIVDNKLSNQELINKGIGHVAGEFSGKDVIEVRQLLDETPSTSLTNYTREQTNEVVVILDELSKLGNEPMLGNSIGNVKAQKALAKLKEIRGEK